MSMLKYRMFRDGNIDNEIYSPISSLIIYIHEAKFLVNQEVETQ